MRIARSHPGGSINGIKRPPPRTWPDDLHVHDERDAALIIANEPLCSKLVTAVRRAGLRSLTARTPLDAIQVLEKHGPQIAYGILTSTPPWSAALRGLLAEEYPHVVPITLVV